MAKSTIYAGLEIGTQKICVVVGEAKRDGAIRILGVGQAPSRGVRKGEIVDFEKVQTCLNDALVRAEDRSDVMIRNVFLGVTGAHIESLNNRGCYRLPDEQSEITEDDVEEAKEIARNVPIPQQNVFLHSVTRQYIVDGQEGVKQPIGREGRMLEADYHIIHGMRARIQNAIRCVREIPLEVEDVVFNPIAAAQVVLTREAKNQGSLMIDFGAGTADYVLYQDGMITASGSIPLGGDHITNDIALALQIPNGRAEKVKIEDASCLYEDVPEDEILLIEDDGGLVIGEVERAFLNEVAYLRTREILDQVKERCQDHLSRLAAGVYLTGGVSLMKGIDSVAKDVFQMKVTRAGSAPVSGVSAMFENPQYSTPIGLIRYAQILDSEKPFLSPLARLGRRMADLLNTVAL
ncbi:MAG: cell division protein FtsA [Verrucomicrobiales bacterium]|nr:cell division protein FtsA [Verrucomicrobiales bacterium]MCP5559570.1 cell division protein FtsA [Verrucomicrobiaceae bacterium]